jgi:hypothetical protein
MTEAYYNATAHGTGIEGFINYANILVDGWFATMFIVFIWLSSVYVGSKSDWKLSGVMSFSFFLCLVSAMIMRLFTIVNETVIFVCIFGLGISIFWMVIER